jgi:hypothetical protein
VTGLHLPIDSANDFHQFGDFAALIDFVAAVDRVLQAVGHVIPKDFFLDAAKCRPHSGNLGDDVDAIPVFANHLREPANLAFDAVQAFFAGSLDVISHGSYIPLEGIFRKRWSRGCRAPVFPEKPAETAADILILRPTAIPCRIIPANITITPQLRQST